MPVYEYACEDCGKVTEVLRKMSEADAAVACEACGSPKTRRSHSVFAAGGASEAGAGSSMPLPMGGGCGCGHPHGPCASG